MKQDGNIEEMLQTMYKLVENVLSKLEPEGEAFFPGEDEYDDGFRKQLLHTAKVGLNLVKNEELIKTLYNKYMLAREKGIETFFSLESANDLLLESDIGLDEYQGEVSFTHRGGRGGQS